MANLLKSTLLSFPRSASSLFAALMLLTLLPYGSASAQAPPVPSAFQDLSSSLNTYLTNFNAKLGSGNSSTYPALMTGSLKAANSNAGPQLLTDTNDIQLQLNALKAMGAKAILVEVGFPMLYEPFLTGQGQSYSAYVAFYQGLATAVRQAGLKLIVENDTLLSNDVPAGWDVAPFYATLNWLQYQQARAQTAAVIAETMQPDYMVVLEEPDTEAANSGQTNANTPSGATAMLSLILTTVQQAGISKLKVGAGVGTWLDGYLGFIQDFVTLPVDFIDMHIYPVNDGFLQNALQIASIAAVAGKPVSMSECWLSKERDTEVDVLSTDQVRARNPFSFWAPLDAYFIKTMQNLANHTQMLFLDPFNADYYFAYQPYDASTENLTPAQILGQETSSVVVANQQAVYTSTGMSHYHSVVVPTDTTPPSPPSGLSWGSENPTTAFLNWTAASDNIGVAGYHILRNGSIVGTTANPYYQDSGLTESTTYTYCIEAFDLAGDISAPSQRISVTTADVTLPVVPRNVVATAGVSGGGLGIPSNGDLSSTTNGSGPIAPTVNTIFTANITSPAIQDIVYADQYPSIRAAMNALNGAGIIVLPRGNVNLPSTLSVGLQDSGIILQGQGVPYNCTPPACATGTVLTWTGSANSPMISVNAAYHVQIRDLLMDGQGTAGQGIQFKSTGSSTSQDDVINVFIQNVTGSPGRGIEVGATSLANVSEIRFDKVTSQHNTTDYYQDGGQTFVWANHLYCLWATTGANIRNGFFSLSHGEFSGNSSESVRVGNVGNKVLLRDMDWEDKTPFLVVEDTGEFPQVEVSDLRALYIGTSPGTIIKWGVSSGSSGAFTLTNSSFATLYGSAATTIALMQHGGAALYFSDLNNTYMGTPSTTSITYSGSILRASFSPWSQTANGNSFFTTNVLTDSGPPGVNESVTLYNSYPAGATTLKLRAGAYQTGAGQADQNLVEIYANDGITLKGSCDSYADCQFGSFAAPQGTPVVDLSGSGLISNDGTQVRWSSTSGVPGSPDTGIDRCGAACVGATNGSTGTGMFQAAEFEGTGIAYASLGTPTKAQIVYCTNCTISACSKPGSGSWAFYTPGSSTWSCPF